MTETLFGIIDLARAQALYPLVQELGPKAQCLFAGSLAEDLRRVSPHLVDLSGDSRLRQRWRMRGLGRAWGILVASPCDIATLTRHFRHFLKARMPDHQIVLFRFYDPRVFRAYLPTCTAEERRAWFGRAVGAFYIETADGSGYAEYRHEDGALASSPVTGVLG